MLKRIIIGLLVVIVIASAGFVIWGSTPAQPMPEAIQALASDSAVTVTKNPWLVFQPAGAQPEEGFIFYPGGRVDYRAYAPAARELASRGLLVVIVPMPLNLAVFNPGAAGDVITAYPGVKTWLIGGHSLGGSMAANYAAQNPGKIKGLVLWASYPAGSDSLAGKPVKVISISGQLDGLATPAKIEASRPLLPADTQWMPIEGGNHAQFGWYGDQGGDNPAQISREEQQRIIVDDTIAFAEQVAAENAK